MDKKVVPEMTDLQQAVPVPKLFTEAKTLEGVTYTNELFNDEQENFVGKRVDSEGPPRKKTVPRRKR